MIKLKTKLLMQIGVSAFFVATFGGALGIYADLTDHMTVGKVGFIIAAAGIIAGWVVVLFGIVVNFWSVVKGGFESIRSVRQRGPTAAYQEAKKRYEDEHDPKSLVDIVVSPTKKPQK